MTGMETVLELRRMGKQPGCVMVDLVRQPTRGQEPLSLAGIVTVEISRADSIGDLDLRPLVGLHVQAFDYDDPKRFRRLCKRIAEVKPRILVAKVGDTLHVRREGEEDRRYAL